MNISLTSVVERKMFIFIKDHIIRVLGIIALLLMVRQTCIEGILKSEDTELLLISRTLDFQILCGGSGKARKPYCLSFVTLLQSCHI